MPEISMLKRLIIKSASIFRIPLNYSGLRIETLDLIKKLDKEKRDAQGILKKQKKYILFFGDSNIFGWNYMYEDSIPAILDKNLKTNNLKKDFIVLNYGVGGAGISDLNISFLKFFGIESDLTVVLNYGLNDGLLSNILKNYLAENKSVNNWQVFYKEKIKDEYEKFSDKYMRILKNISAKNIKVILIGLYRINKTKFNKKPVTEFDYLQVQNAVLSALNKKIREAADKAGAVFIDLWNIIGNDGVKKNYLQEDGLHLSQKAYKIISSEIEAVL